MCGADIFVESSRLLVMDAERKRCSLPVRPGTRHSSNSNSSVASTSDPVDIDRFHHEIELIKQSMHEFDIRLIECESYPRRESLVISGIPNNIHQNRLEDTVLDILYYMNLTVTSKDISACH